jgi:hypothetical protein
MGRLAQASAKNPQEFRFKPQRRYADGLAGSGEVRGAHEAISTTGGSLLDERPSSAEPKMRAG